MAYFGPFSKKMASWGGIYFAKFYNPGLVLPQAPALFREDVVVSSLLSPWECEANRFSTDAALLLASPSHHMPFLLIFLQKVGLEDFLCQSTNMRVWLSFKKFSLFIVVQSLNHVWLFVTPWTAARWASLSFSLSEFAETRVPWVGDTIQPPHPLPPSILLPLIFPSIRVLPEELASDISLQHLYVEPRIPPSPQRTYALWQLDLIEWQESKAQQMKNSYIISHFRDRLILLHSVVHTLGNCAEPSGEALRLKWRGFSGRCCLFWECLSL